ncbi:MAG: tetratricopeptide repeat protein [Desulfomonile tiedjei]|uniref:Tetratricopeptide repeat protein n=1 Tax=Desulfomonile tiedjei TaxID=2358 RepID=A0A9D6V240_9BACT|nr:tetratricopeptide repeat protein [Desulfomonile tiedjei]
MLSSRTMKRLLSHGLLILILPYFCFAASEPNPVRLLKQAKAEEDPAKRIEILDKALTDQSLKGDLLSAIFLERAMAYKALQDCFHAIEDFNSSMAHSRKSSPALLEKIHCLILVDQLDEASRALESMLLAGPGSAQAYVLKGMIYEKEGFLSKAEDEYSRALHYEPNSSVALDKRSKALMKAGKPRKALDDINALAKLARNDPEVFMTRAMIHVKLKDYSAALADYGQVETLSPGNDRVLKEKVLVFFKTDQPQKALEALSAHITANPDDVEGLVLLARSQILLKNPSKADAILRQALTKKPLFAPAYLYRGLVVRNDDPDAALANLNRALELDSSLVDAYKERARIFTDLNEPVRAAADLTAAADLDPADGEIFAMRALSLVRRMLYDAAIADFTRALECLPGDNRILYDRAVTYYLRDDSQQALADIDALLQTKPDTARALSLRGVLNFSLGKQAQARDDFDKAVSISPNDPQVRNNRGFFFYRIGEFGAAMEDFSRALKADANYAVARHNLGLTVNRKESDESGDNPAAN